MRNLDFIEHVTAEPSGRVQRLRLELTNKMNKKISWWGEGLTILDDEEMLNKPLIVRKAKAVEKVLKEMPVSIFNDELIVGTMRMHSVGSGQTFPDYASEEEKKEAAKKGLSIKSVFGHSPPNHFRVLSKGISGIKKEIEHKTRTSTGKRENAFFEAASICCDAVVYLAKRYSTLASQLAVKAINDSRKKELERIADICFRVPEYPASNFHEAVQSFWFIHLALHCTLNFAPCGRIDQFLYPFFKKDISEGNLGYDEALEIIECLLIKFHEAMQIKKEDREDHSDFGDLSLGNDPNESKDLLKVFDSKDPSYANQFEQTATLGGQTKFGEDSSNELTYLFIEAMQVLHLVQPSIHVRLSHNSPEWLFQKCCQSIQSGGGLPVLYNDDVLIPALVSKGIPETDARTYASDGCWEPVIPGKTEYHWSPIHTLKCLEWIFTRGMEDKKKRGVDTGDVAQYKSFDRLMDAFKLQLDKHIKTTIDNVLKCYRSLSTIAPDPLLSILIDGCIEKGLDITEGGAKYIMNNLYLTGLPNTADGLAAIKKLVFEEREFSLKKLRNILQDNFNNEEEFRQRLIKNAPKFGNDLDSVDKILVDIVNFFVQRVEEYTKDLTWIKMCCGIATFPNYKVFGRMVGASPDGRKSGEPLSSNITPYPGRDMLGPTAVLNSCMKVNNLKLAGGAEIDLFMDSKGIKGNEGRRRLMGFVKTFLDLGCSVLAITVTDNKTLLRAQKEPEKYRNLRVRMGGWQAYFVALDREHQDYIIHRTKHGYV